MKKKHLFLFISLLPVLLYSCKKEQVKYTADTLNDYYPLHTGKYITYKLDSTVFLNFGTKDTTISYQVKYLVDSMISDNLGRPAYRIFRFIRKQDQGQWFPSGTFMAIHTANRIEFIENNLRFVKSVAFLKMGLHGKEMNLLIPNPAIAY